MAGQPAKTLEPVFDGGVLRDMFGGEVEVISALLQTFLASTASSMTDLHSALAMPDPGAVAALAHRIKGAARMSGAILLADAAQALEQAAKAGTISATRRAAVQLGAQWQLLRVDPAFEAACATRQLPQ